MSKAQTTSPLQAQSRPARRAMAEQKRQAASAAPATESAEMSEKQFMRDHSLYSAASSWLFAIAGATNIGVLSVMASKILTAAEQGRPLFRSKDPAVEPVMGNKKYNRIALMMMAFGGACMAVSNWLESKKVVTEWQLGAGKLQRKINIAENEPPPASDSASAPPKPKNWAASVQTKTSDTVDRTTPALF